MKLSNLAAVAAALAFGSAGAVADPPPLYTVTPINPFEGASAATSGDIDGSYADEVTYEYTPAPGYHIAGYSFTLTGHAFVGPDYTGTTYGPSYGHASATMSAPGTLGYTDYGTDTNFTVSGAAGPGNLFNEWIRLAASSTIYCIVPQDQCNDIAGDLAIVPASIDVDTFTIIPDLVSDVPEPLPLSMLLVGGAALASIRRRSSSPLSRGTGSSAC